MKSLIEKASAGVAHYARQFATVGATQKQLGLNEEAGLQGTLRQAVHEVEVTLGKHDDRGLQLLMLMMRRHEKDFLARLDPKYGEDMKKRATEFTAGLAASSIPEAERRTITQRMEEYHRDYFALQAGQLTLQAEIKALTDLFAKVEPVLDEIEKQIEADYQSTKTELSEARASTSRTLMISIAVVVLLVAIFAFFVSRGVTAPLLAISGVMARLAQGDNAVTVSGTARRDEIGSHGQIRPGVQRRGIGDGEAQGRAGRLEGASRG